MTANRERTISLLWNGSSGWRDSDRERSTICELLSGDGASVEVVQVERGMNIIERIREIASSDVDVLVAAGGDGTINAAASVLVHKRAALGVIPAGTLNHFARDLHIPLEPEEAARALVHARIAAVDAANVNGHVFVNNAVLGFFPEYRERRERLDARGLGASRVGRFVATVAALCMTLWRLPRLRITLDVDGRKRTLQTPFVLVGNNEHKMESLALGERSRLDEGLLWVYVLRPRSRWRLLRLALGLLLGRTSRQSLFEIFPARAVTIDARHPQIGVGLDGEMVRMNTPLHFKSLPGALRVLTPNARYCSHL